MDLEYELTGHGGWREVGERKSGSRWGNRGLASDIHSSAVPHSPTYTPRGTMGETGDAAQKYHTAGKTNRLQQPATMQMSMKGAPKTTA